MTKTAERCNRCKTYGISPSGHRCNMGVVLMHDRLTGKVGLFWKTVCNKCGARDYEEIPPGKVDIDAPGRFGEHSHMVRTPLFLERMKKARQGLLHV